MAAYNLTDELKLEEKLVTDPSGYVYADGVKICRVDWERQTLLFLDRNRERATERRSREVAVPLAALVRLLEG